MKKILALTFVPLLFFSLIACSGKNDKKKTTTLDTQYFILEKDGMKSEATLTFKEDALEKEKVIITASYKAAGATTKQEAETMAEKFKTQTEGIKGVDASTEVTETNIILSSTTDYSKADLAQLGIQKNMMSKDNKFPSVKVRIQDYKGMGYTEKP